MLTTKAPKTQSTKYTRDQRHKAPNIQGTKDTKHQKHQAYPGLQNMLLCLVAPPAALDPDGCTPGLQELHPGREGSEGCLQPHHVLTVLQVGPALACSSVDGLQHCHHSLNPCSNPACVLVLPLKLHVMGSKLGQAHSCLTDMQALFDGHGILKAWMCKAGNEPVQQPWDMHQ